ncbi:hypothetical protein FSP39_016558 [Pinctada imbricata]|uniref:Bridge-like lipid transfer protein family member 1 C-terminal domain-containing protein n=1 Tax=Pinctada imbricata TaxID=66713 RepID=A0AA88Y7U2_PINIB|nr:hypothetical protein FSP39_016558 [Pinctada imbricata]
MRSDSYTDKSVVTTPSEAGHWTIGGSSLETPISDTRSFSSRKGSLDESRKSVSHSNSLTSYDVSKSIQGQGSSPNLDVQSRSSSKKSLSSPFLRRQDLSDRAFSAVSLESERYFSADEDVHSLGEQKDDSMLTEDDINITIKSQNSTTTSQGNETITDDDRDKTLKAGEDGTVFTPKEHESTDSYESAPSDVTDSDEFDEDFDPDNIPEIFSMVDLHSQVNKPIPESPILMSCYSGHMTHLQCNDWSAASPNQHFRYKYGMKADQSVYSLSSVGQSVQYVHSSACVPHFMRLRQGFSTKLMKTRDNFTATTPSRDGSIDILDPWSHAVETQNFEVHKTNTEQSLLDNASITTAVVKMTGSMDIVLTPLLLESIQRYAEAVTPTLQQLHPSALIDGLHSRCLDRLKQQNRLKKESLSSEENRASKLIQERQFSTESRTQTGEMKTSSIQALFTLAKINICTLQAGIMEEKIQFSALENIHDLTCVSLLAVCIDRIECQLLSNSHSCKMLADNAGMSNITQSGSSPKKTSSKKSEISFQAGEMDKQMTEISREEDVGTIHITRVHLQLQRLLKNSNYTDDVLLTAIPDYKSKVLFRFEKDALSDSFRFATSPRRRSSVKQESFGSSPKQHGRRQSSREGRPPFSRQSSKDSESRSSTLPRLFKQASIDEQGGSKVRRQESMSRHGGVGFIMFECGLEEIKVTAVRRLGFKDVSDERFLRKMENVAQKLEEIQNSTRVQLETSLGQLDEERTNATPRFKLNDEDMTSVHSWDSRVSIASGSTSLSEKETNKPLTGDASSGTLELHTVWLNFAAPPPVSIKRKVDFTRLDWNLLSTATTAINGWLNPLDRMVTEIQRMVQTLTHRTNSVMACVMTNALEVPGIQLPYKYSKITSLARTFQEDPSCQLFTVLRKYLQKEGTGPVEIAVTADTLPQLITIQKGILALTRQWKNVLYMPNISNIDFKSKKSIHPYNVKFSLAPDFTDDGNETECADQYDVVDERTSLLLAEGGSVHQSVSMSDLTEQKLDGQDMHDGTSFASALSSKHKKTSSGLKPPFVYGSPGSPQAGNMESPERRFTPVPGMTRNDSNYSFHSAAASLHSAEHDPSPPNTPMKLEPPKPSILKNKIDKTHDLYQWMAKQQDFKGMSLEEDSQSLRRQDSLLATFGSGWSQDDSRLDLTERQLAMATSIVQLADAQSLFKPFLQSIGLHVEAVRPTAMMKKFGGSLSLQGKLEFLKIQITDSEKHRSKKGKKVKLVHFKDNASAFSCENFSVSVGMKDVVDFESKEQGDGGERGDLQFSFAMHKLEAKPTTLQVNFMINCETVTQNVDMPLLRLIHQFATMAENVKDTKQELKQSHTNDEWTKTHRKQDSKDSSSSVDTQQSDTSQTNQFSPGSGETIPSGWKKENITSQSGNVLESGQERVKPLRSSPAPYRKTIGSPKVDNLQLPLKRLSQGKEQRKLGLPGSEGQRSEDKSQAVLTPPQSLNLSDSVTIEMEDVSSPVLAEKTLVDEIKETTPKCWRTLYHILDLYSTLPEMKTVKRKPSSKLPVIEEEPEPEQGLRDGNFEPADTPSDTSRIGINRIGETTMMTGATEAEEGRARLQQNTNDTAKSTFNKTKFKQSIYVGESIPLVVFGIAKVEKVNILAVLSGLKLEACLDNVHASGTYREKVKGFVHRKSSESSATAHIGNTLMKLKEGLPPHMQTVVTVTIAKSQALHTTILRKGKEHNSAMVSIGIIDIDIPQHPVVLHGMMARSTRQLSTTLQEFRRPTSRSSRNLDIPERSEVDATNPQDSLKRQKNVKVTKQENTNRPTFINIHFKAMFQGLTTGASLLPSLKAQHKFSFSSAGSVVVSAVDWEPIGPGFESHRRQTLQYHCNPYTTLHSLPRSKTGYLAHETSKITLSGMTGKKARFRLDLPSHQLSFRSKVQTTETSLPSEAEIELPPIQMFADYRHQGRSGTGSENLTDGLTLKEGSYLNAEAEVGMLEHSLTTDLLNHLVFVQKVFMTEVNELVQKVSGSDQPVPLWVEEGEKVVKESTSSLLYSLLFRFKGIQITATTPTSSAVRLETGSVNLEVSNRVQMEARETTQEQQQTEYRWRQGKQPRNNNRQESTVYTVTTPTSSAVRLETGSVNLEVSNRVQMEARETTQEQQQTAGSQKMFMKAQIDLNLALGQLIKDEMIPGVSRDQEALLITLTRPIILAQPQAFDKAVLVWLNYKNAYEYWTEQRLALNNEVQRATRQFIDRIPQMTSTTPSSFSTLFLQLTVEDMGICVPVLANTLQMQGTNTTSRFIESEPGSALVFTLKSTQISACSSGSLVSKGRFQDFCLRFADDFETSWDDWKPAPIEDPVMNACVVPEGTYEVCSRTINKQASDPLGNAKWILNVQWEMQGIAVHLDTKIGKQLSALGKTLTSLTGDDDNDFMEEDEDQRLDSIFSQSDEFINLSPQRRPSQVQDSLPPYVYDTSMDPKQRFRLIEQEMNEQAKLVQDLKQLGASQQTIETESKKLEELKGILFQDFRREVLNKLKNKSESRTSALKDQLGIGNMPTSHLRSKSYGGPIKEKKTHTDIDRLAAYNEELSHSRITSLDMTRTLPAKVQFGDTSAYSPPETPDSLTSSTETSHHSDSPSHSGRPYSESPSHCGRSYSESPSHSGRPYPDSPSHSGRPHPDSPSHYGRQNLDSPSHSGRPHPVVRNISSTESSTSTDSEEEDGTLKRDSVFDSSITIPEDYQAHSSKHDTLTPSVGSGGSSGKGSTEPNVDFELDVKVFIDSGKCVLHPKDNKEEEVKRNHQKRDKTPTPDSPPPGRRKKKFSESGSTPLSSQSKKCGTPQQQQQQQIDLTVFFLPSIDLKVHYNSKISPGIMDATSNPDIGDDKSESEGRVASTDEEVVLRKKPIALRHSPVTQDSVDSSVSFTSARRLGVKKANLYAWLSLQSLPEEMIISPCLLDFLEQALEPLPLGLVTGVQSSKKVDVVGSVLNVDLESSYSSLPLITSQTSFPVDVVVFIRVEPSVIRFNCLPTSRVECLLKVPALEFVFSTKSSDIEGNFSEGTPPMKNKVPKKSRDRHTSGGKSSTDFRTRVGSTASQADQSSSMSAGGLSFTAALSDFSLYIFHPYGGGAQRKLATPTYNLGSIQEHGGAWSEMSCRDMLSLNVFVCVYTGSIQEHGGAWSEMSRRDMLSLNVFVCVYTGSIQEHGGAWSEMSRRDMLSLNVEFVKLNISRSRKLEMKMTESGVKEPLTKSNVVRFSTICDIGSAAFKYDMRRLSEILTFPKAWYNRNLARRMFLGDESYVQTGEDEWESSSSTGSYHSDTTPSPVAKLFTSSPTLHQLTVPSEPFRQTHHRRVSSGDKMKVQLSTELKNVIDSRAPRKGSVSVPQSPTDAVFHDGTLHGTPVAHRSRHRGSLTQSEILKQKRSSVGQVSAKPAITWETLVLFAVNLSKLDLHVNMSNVMGNTVWTTQQIKSQGRLAIDSSGHKDLNITSGMGSSQFESKGGVVGGTIDLNDLSVTFEVCEDPQDGRQPLHCAVFNLQALECRMDYMGSSVLMARLSQLAIKLKDEWHVQAKAENDTPLATQRPAFLFAHGDFEWDQFHIMISRSTTPDIIKMVSKIEEFITMQFNSSKRMLSSIGPLSGGRRTSDRNRKLSDEEDCIWDIRHHRHWQKALSLIIGCRFSMLPSLIPKEGTILGGNMTLKGKNLTLACFHGINFRSKSWALFTVNEPLIMFETESQKLPQGGIHIVENLTFYIGHDFTSTYRDSNTMVSIAKLSRTHSMPPTFTSVQEWFHYAFATSEVKGLDNFPHISHVDDDGPIRRLRKLQTYNHDTEMIFILPCLQLHLKTIHTQTEEEPQADDPKPVVECSFVTEFEDHIRVAMDAELILFLHDLVYMYIKEKDKGTKPSYSQSGKTTGKSPDTERKKVTDPTTALKQDWRDFKCNTWHLEPTVRLLHWASKQIDPVGVDALLQKLGFTHARVTIPKWMQRGFMDPLDRFISFLIERLILALKENNPEQDLTETDEG